MLVMFDEVKTLLLAEPVRVSGSKQELNRFRQSICKNIDYPKFGKERNIMFLRSYSLTDKKFSGFIRYETTVTLAVFKRIILEITDAYEGVEVLVNGKSAGLQVVPAFVFDITAFCSKGDNSIRIEVAATLERENKRAQKDSFTGITGKVNLYTE